MSGVEREKEELKDITCRIEILAHIHVIMNKRLLDARPAADYLSIGKTLLYQLAAKGKIPGIKINSRRLFDVNDLDEFVDKLKSEQAK